MSCISTCCPAVPTKDTPDAFVPFFQVCHVLGNPVFFVTVTSYNALLLFNKMSHVVNVVPDH